METTIVGLSYDISVESTYSKHGPVWLVLYVRNSRLRSRHGAWGRRHWRVKYPRCRRSKRVHFGFTATSFGKDCIEIFDIYVLFLKLTSFGAPATQYVRPFFLDFSFLHHTYRRVLMGTLFGSQIVLAIPKKMVKENLLGAKVGYF